MCNPSFMYGRPPSLRGIHLEIIHRSPAHGPPRFPARCHITILEQQELTNKEQHLLEFKMIKIPETSKTCMWLSFETNTWLCLRIRINGVTKDVWWLISLLFLARNEGYPPSWTNPNIILNHAPSHIPWYSSHCWLYSMFHLQLLSYMRIILTKKQGEIS